MIEKLNIAALLPELILVVMAMAIAMIDLFDTSVRRHNTYVLTLMTLGLVVIRISSSSTRLPLCVNARSYVE